MSYTVHISQSFVRSGRQALTQRGVDRIIGRAVQDMDFDFEPLKIVVESGRGLKKMVVLDIEVEGITCKHSLT